MAEGSEFAAIARWIAALPPGALPPHPHGDDVAWLELAGSWLALSVDTLVEGVHFDALWSSPQDAGWKALAAAVSDLAAAGAAPRGCLVAVSAPDFDADGWADGAMEGLGDAAERFACPVLGGDVTGSKGGRTLSVTVVGQASRPLGRAGARPGDLLQISGPTGWSGAALALLMGGTAPAAVPPRALSALRRPTARTDRVEVLATAHAAVDISDGLLADAAHLAQRSGVGLVFDEHRLVADDLISAVGSAAARSAALGGGEDYELLAAAPHQLAGFEVIGSVVEGPAGLFWSDGSDVPKSGRGWDHGGPRMPRS